MEIPSLTVVGTPGQAASSAISSPLLRGALSTIAQHLGLDQSSLEAALAKGASVEDLAARHGVSSADLQDAVVTQIGDARTAAGQAPIAPDTLARMVARAFSQGRRSAPDAPSAPAAPRDPLAVYGSAGRMIDEPIESGISVLA